MCPQVEKTAAIASMAPLQGRGGTGVVQGSTAVSHPVFTLWKVALQCQRCEDKTQYSVYINTSTKSVTCRDYGYKDTAQFNERWTQPVNSSSLKIETLRTLPAEY